MRRPSPARRWTCTGCSVAVGRMDGGHASYPDNWERCDEGDFCLTCRRQRAAEAAQAAVPGDSGSEIRAKARRAGLIAFEVRRTPDLTDGMIARACHTSAAAVAATRKRLHVPAGPVPTGRGSARQMASTEG